MDVLIVDDDPAVLTLHGRMLERAGFMVDTAENGLQAIAKLQEHPFRAILLDVQMPFLKGQSFFDELRTSYPDMVARVIFVTGWAGEPKVKEFLEQAGRPILQKPVEIETLVQAVRGLVDQ